MKTLPVFLALCAAVALARAASAQATSSGGAVAPGTSLTAFEVNNLANGTGLDVRAAYNFDVNQDLYVNNQTGTGTLTDAYNPLSGFVALAHAGSSLKATVAGRAGALQAYGLAWSVDAGSGAQALTRGFLADTLNLSTAGRVRLSGALKGWADSSGYASANVDFRLYLVDPNSLSEDMVTAFGGYTIHVGESTHDFGEASIPPSGGGAEPTYPFSVDVDLPAGDVYLFAELSTQAISSSFSNDGITYHGGGALTDFGHTLEFSLQTPSDITVTPTLGGLVEVNNNLGSAAPEPSSIALLALAGGAALLRRKRR